MLNLESTLIYTVILLIVALILLLIAVVVGYLRLINKYLALKQGGDEQIDPKVLLAQAQAKSQKILEDAYSESKKIMAKSQEFLVREEGEIAKELGKTTQTYLNVYSKTLDDINTNSTKVVQALPNEIKTFVVTAIDDFRLSLSQEVAKVANQTSQALKEGYIKAQQEVEAYKKERLRQIDEQALKLIQEVTRKVLGKEISLEEHEKLVLKALEEAKRQGIL